MDQDELFSKFIKFPVVCHYKVIAEDREDMKLLIERVFAEVNMRVEFKAGSKSAKGKYVTYNADVTIHSLELMKHIDKGLRMIRGVKVVL